MMMMMMMMMMMTMMLTTTTMRVPERAGPAVGEPAQRGHEDQHTRRDDARDGRQTQRQPQDLQTLQGTSTHRRLLQPQDLHPLQGIQ